VRWLWAVVVEAQHSGGQNPAGMVLQLPGGARAEFSEVKQVALQQVAIVAVKINENETHILFKVMEYKSKRDISLAGGLSFNTSFVPLHMPEVSELTDKMKAQIEEGDKNRDGTD
jgi:hypothetical protein